MDIADLDLAEPALGAAILLKQAHPNISFTSGRRAVKDQARAMASNVIHNRQWIHETYTGTAESASLQRGSTRILRRRRATRSRPGCRR